MAVEADSSRSSPVETPALDGACLADVSTALVQLHRRFYGRGPTRARTICEQDVLTTVLEDILTTVERTLIERGKRELVVEVRSSFQAAMAAEFCAEVERVTGRAVLSFTSGVDVNCDLSTETFVLAPYEEAQDAADGTGSDFTDADSRAQARAREARSMSRAVRAQAEQIERRHRHVRTDRTADPGG